MSDIISKKIKELFAITNELESLYPGRKFTIDGHTIGSIGEVLAAEKLKLDLLPNSTEKHDAIDSEGRLYQIKATTKDRVALSAEPDNLIVIKIFSDGTWDIIYNGPGRPIWKNTGKKQKNGQRPITLSKIQKIKSEIL
jgi:hypothetical protein